MAGSKAVSFGHYQPSRTVTNDELADRLGTSDAWIRDRVGVRSRRIAAPATRSPTWRLRPRKPRYGSPATARPTSTS